MIAKRNNNNVLRWACAFAVLGVYVVAPGSVRAQSTPNRSVIARLPQLTLEELRRDVQRARAIDLRPFVLTREIVRNAPIADAQARNRKAPIALELAKLGPSGLMPMLELLADGPTDSVPPERIAELRNDIVEAVGLLRQGRALPVLGAILDNPAESEDTVTVVAEAVARLGSDEAATRVIRALDAARDQPDRARAIIAGMGECRRIRVVEAITARLRSPVDDRTARVAARALGRAGNAWAWKTETDRTEEARVRDAAARALVELFVHRSGEARTAADHSLMVIDAPRTPALIAEARRAASPELAKELDALATRFANNPSR